MKNEEKNPRSIFCEAIEITTVEERHAYLDKICGDDKKLRAEVDSLLEAHDNEKGMLKVPTDLLEESITPLSESPGTVIDKYKLLEKIGEGGMAVVYMAEQEKPVQRKVALKIIKLGMDTKQVIARFEAERQALALMDHPNIAKVLDAGATETGRPYFVMDLVKGIVITKYCDENNLSTEERLRLFTHVCSAIQHAHQKGIIHRDIKPTNVLVQVQQGQSIPKVIDFGIAKAVNQKLTEKTLFTRYEQLVGTPEYMSPEQAEWGAADIDTRTDIYSLGVLLYQLLTGTTPFDAQKLREAGYNQMLEIIRREEPAKPSTMLDTVGETLSDIASHRKSSPEGLKKLLHGDLDWIVMKAMDTAESVVDYHPEGFDQSVAFRISGSQFVGAAGWGSNLSVWYKDFSCEDGYHAILWKVGSDTVVDLHEYLPEEYINSVACDIDAYGTVAGYAVLEDGTTHAIIWKALKYGGGSGTEQDPYQIGTAEDLVALGENTDDYDKHFIMTADIDLSEYVFDRAVIAPDEDDVELGFQGTVFTGEFEGNNHSISNLFINSQGRDSIGLFGGAIGFSITEPFRFAIKNLRLINPVIEAGNSKCVGSLIGSGSFILNCHVENCNITGEEYVGGLAGVGSVSNCSMNNGKVFGVSSVGGLIGETSGEIESSWVNGEVVGVNKVGGLVGATYTTQCWFCLTGINKSFSNSIVQGEKDVGGLVGFNDGGYEDGNYGIGNSYSHGIVNGNRNVGGLVGLNEGIIYNCFSSCQVNGDEYIGGLIGLCGNSWNGSRNCYWDIDISGTSVGHNGSWGCPDCNQELGLPTSQFHQQSTFTNWDFINVWNIGEGQTYPYLRKYSTADLNKDRIVNLFDLSILAEQWLQHKSN